MAITEESRFQLHQRLETVLGKEHATTLMEHLPPVGWADVATKADVAGTKADIGLVRRDMDREFAAVRSDMAREFASVRGDIDRLRQDMNRDFAAVRSELETGLARQTDAVRVATSELRTQVAESLLGMERRLGAYRTHGMAFQGVLALIVAITVVVTR